MQARMHSDRLSHYRLVALPRGCVIVWLRLQGVCAALKRHGIHFDCFESSDGVGGNWYHGVYETVHIISSKKVCIL